MPAKFEIVHVDFETRAKVDLKAAGTARYVQCPYFDSACVAWAPDHLPVRGAHLFGAPCPTELADHVEDGGLIGVHNRSFELQVWAENRRRDPKSWPELRVEQVVDTMLLGRALSLPGSLDLMAKALKLNVVKDEVGYRLMLKLCKPRKPRKGEDPNAVLWHGTDEEFERQLEYCKRDVEVERDVCDALPPLHPTEHETTLLDWEINRRGVYIDIDTVKGLQRLADIEKDRLNSELFELTDEKVKTSKSYVALKKWLHEVKGRKDIPNLQKGTVTALLDQPEGHLEPDVKRVIEICAEANKSSISKLDSMLSGADANNRAHDLLEFHGASTGRWAGRRIQVHNMIRTPEGFGVAEASEVRMVAAASDAGAAIKYLNSRFENATAAVSWSLRSLIQAAPGKRLLASDWSSIEGRVLAWLAGENWKLKAFRKYDTLKHDEAGNIIRNAKGDPVREGHDLYILSYGRSFAIDPNDVTKAQRQIGKVQELALGYQGAHGAFLSMGKNYNVDLDAIAKAVESSVGPERFGAAIDQYWEGSHQDLEEYLTDFRAIIQNAENRGDEILHLFDPTEETQDAIRAELTKKKRFGLPPKQWAALRIIVDSWREAHPHVVQFWHSLNDAAIQATMYPGKVTRVGKISYKLVKIEGRRFLLCQLPSGRCLGYPNARIVYERRTFIDRRTGEPYEKKFPKLIFEGVSSKTKKWCTQRAYGGLLAENVTQAVARDVLRDALLRLDKAGYDIVMHVHDEIVCEMPHGVGTLEEFENTMSILEPWAGGLPVAVEGWEGNEYRK